MKLALVLLGALLHLTCARTNIYQTGRRDKQQHPDPAVHEKNALPRAFAQRAGAAELAFPKPPPRSPGNRLAGQEAPRRGQYSINLGGPTAAPKTTAAVQVDWPWSGRSAPTEAPQVLVATVMTTITKFAVMTSTVTNNIIELLTRTETETEFFTRHSTRTVQVITTSTTRLTHTTTQMKTETSTIFSLVPYTITEVETLTRTIENVILTTFTIPASTIHKTHFSTLTQSAQTVTMTEFLQPMIETIGVETVMMTETVTTASVETVTVTLEPPPQPLPLKLINQQLPSQEAVEADFEEVSPSLFERLLEGNIPDIVDAETAQYNGDEEAPEESWYLDGSFTAVPEEVLEENNEPIDDPEVNAEEEYPSAEPVQEEDFEFVSELPTGAEVLGEDNAEEDQEQPSDSAQIEPEVQRRVQAAIQQWPFMAAGQRAGRVY